MRLIVLLAVALSLAGCGGLLLDRSVNRLTTPPVDYNIALIRRQQVVADIERLNIVLRRTRPVDNRIALQLQIDRLEEELRVLNIVIGE